MLRLLSAITLFAAVAAAADACGDPTPGAADASSDVYGVIPPAEAGGDDATSDGGTSVWTTMRLAHLSPDAGPIDFCWRPAKTATFTGPVLRPAGVDAGGASDAGDAQAHALEFAGMSGDVSFPVSGTVDIAIVAAGETSCDAPKLVDQVTLDAGKHATVALVGLARPAPGDAGGDAALSIVAFTDDPTPDAQAARVRVIHAALGWAAGADVAPSLAVHTGDEAVSARVSPRQASKPSTTPPVDALGYAAVAPIAGSAPIRLDALDDAGGATWSASPFDLDMAAATVHTAFIVSLADGLGVLWCREAKTSSPLAACTLQKAP